MSKVSVCATNQTNIHEFFPQQNFDFSITNLSLQLSHFVVISAVMVVDHIENESRFFCPSNKYDHTFWNIELI